MLYSTPQPEIMCEAFYDILLVNVLCILWSYVCLSRLLLKINKTAVLLLGYYFLHDTTPVAKFIVPDWGDKVDSGKWLSYRPAWLHRLAGQYDNPMTESTLSLQSGTITLATGLVWCSLAGLSDIHPYAGVNYIPHSGIVNLANGLWSP
jgi:hypothetical protein